MNNRLLFLLLCFAVFAGCKSATEPGPSYNYFPLTVGSHWSYVGDASYTRTVIGDTVISGKTYAIIRQSNNDSIFYYRKDGNTIYLLQTDTLGVPRDCKYVDPTPGASGGYATLTKGRTTIVTYVNTKQGFRDTVDSKVYANVFIEHIRSEIKYQNNPIVTEGDYYFADGVGLIDQVVSFGTEELTDYEIK